MFFVYNHTTSLDPRGSVAIPKPQTGNRMYHPKSSARVRAELTLLGGREIGIIEISNNFLLETYHDTEIKFAN